MTEPARTLEAFGAAFLRVHHLVHSDEVAEMTSKQGFTPKSREDAGRRASGSHTDPTVSTLLDDRRWEVAARAAEAEQALKAALLELRRAEATLRLATGG